MDLAAPICQLTVDTWPQARVGCQGLVVWGKLPQTQGSGQRCHPPLWVGPVIPLIWLQAWVQTPTLQIGALVFWHRCPMDGILLHRACCAQGGGPCLLAEEDDALLRPKELCTHGQVALVLL